MTVFDLMRNALLAGLGAQEKVKEFIDELVKKGELSESQGAKLVKEWTDKADKSTEQFSKSINDVVTKTLDMMSLPSKEDLSKLDQHVQSLSARVSKLEAAGGEAPKKG